jgi:hypothetical protein
MNVQTGGIINWEASGTNNFDWSFVLGLKWGGFAGNEQMRRRYWLSTGAGRSPGPKEHPA